MNNDFKKLRQEVAWTNLEILGLLNKRASLVKEIGRLKDKTSVEYYDPVREAEMIEELFRNNQGPLNNEMIKEIFTSIFAVALHFMGNERGEEVVNQFGA